MVAYLSHHSSCAMSNHSTTNCVDQVATPHHYYYHFNISTNCYSMRKHPAELVKMWTACNQRRRAIATAGEREQSCSPRWLLLLTASTIPSLSLSRCLSHCIQ